MLSLPLSTVILLPVLDLTNSSSSPIKIYLSAKIPLASATSNVFAVAEVKGIDYTTTTTSIGTIGADSALIEEGDNFGFDGGFI